MFDEKLTLSSSTSGCSKHGWRFHPELGVWICSVSWGNWRLHGCYLQQMPAEVWSVRHTHGWYPEEWMLQRRRGWRPFSRQHLEFLWPCELHILPLIHCTFGQGILSNMLVDTLQLSKTNAKLITNFILLVYFYLFYKIFNTFRTRQHHTTQESGGVWFFIAARPKRHSFLCTFTC